jgi:hypothetical protein
MPRRRAARKMVSPARMSTSRSSMLKVLGFAEPFVVLMVSISAKCEGVMRGQKRVEDARERAYDPRIHLIAKTDGLPGQARQ